LSLIYVVEIKNNILANWKNDEAAHHGFCPGKTQAGAVALEMP